MPLRDVESGELITAQYVNELVAKINNLETLVQQLSGTIGTGIIIVPNFFGMSLGSALQTLNEPTIALQRGSIIDAAGNNIVELDAQVRVRLVINQSPTSGQRVDRGTPVNLVIALEQEDSQPPANMVITGVVPSTQRIGQSVRILGSNFGSNRDALEATINDHQLPITFLSGTGDEVHVTLTEDLPNAPTDEGETITARITLRNVNLGTSVVSPDITIEAAPPASPTIDSIEVLDGDGGAIANPGDTVGIVGSNLLLENGTTTVRFAGVGSPRTVTPQEGSDSDRLEVAVPNMGGDVTAGVEVVIDLDDGTQLVSNTESLRIER
jgi:hypothetical protein